MTDWFGLHLCLIGDQVGCDDSSKGMHATKHSVNIGHLLLSHYPTNLGNGAMYIRYMDNYDIRVSSS